MKKLFVLVMAACCLTAACADRDGVRAQFDERGNLSGVIYGDDSVRALKDSEIQGPAEFQKNVQASAALIDLQELHQKADRDWILNDKTVEERYRTCPEFKMSAQVSAAFCSAVLISPDVALTAAHCLSAESEHACDKTALVFGFDQTVDQSPGKTLARRQVYRCKRVLDLNSAVDYAFIQLDRAAEGVSPVNLTAIPTDMSVGENIYTLGYPVGTAKKLSTGRVRAMDPASGNPRASLDIYYGNSGGPVFDARTHRLVGVVMNGEEDFVETKNRCQMPKRCADDRCLGEEVSPLARISKSMNQQLLKALRSPEN